jgi:2-iminobutanoate/2-iminopropanoate deaminase
MRRSAIVFASVICLALGPSAGALAATQKAAGGSTRQKSALVAPRQKSDGARRTAGRGGPRVEYLKNTTGTRSLPFSEAVRVGHMLYLSGQIGVDAGGALVAGGIEAETRQTFENMRAVLERHGSSLARVVKCTVMLADVKNEFSAMNAVYRTYFAPDRMPARSTFGASGLVLGARVEIECWATVR